MTKSNDRSTILPISLRPLSSSTPGFELDAIINPLELEDDEDEERPDAEAEEIEAEGLLTGERKEREDGHVLLNDVSSKEWLKIPSLRFILLSLLSLISLLLIGLVVHPSSSIATYYHSDKLLPGLFAPGVAQIGSNPLPTTAPFSDVPFARVSLASTDSVRPEGKLSNGTHAYERTVIMVSLDGFKADYLERGQAPFLSALASKGLRATSLRPSFPSLTFPNHWTILTGLHPSSHGIVANSFYDPVLEEQFSYADTKRSWSPQWWGGVPIWSAAIKSGLQAAVLFWPGPPVTKDGTRPTYFYPYEDEYSYLKKVDQIATWIDMPLAKRPSLILAYAPEVDQAGHTSGPTSETLEDSVSEMDHFAQRIMQLLEERNLTEIVDVIFLSDHGMAETKNEQLIFLDDILGEEGFAGITHQDGWPAAALRFGNSTNTTLMMSKLVIASERRNSGFNVYTPETMPERYHFTGNPRIAPIYVAPEAGWIVTTRKEHAEIKNDLQVKGAHGYDNEDPSMQAIFIATGPFATSWRQSRVSVSKGKDTSMIIPTFQNTEVYNLVGKLLGIEKELAPNNGTSGFWGALK